MKTKKKIIITILCLIAVILIVFLSLSSTTDEKTATISGNLNNYTAPTVETRNTYKLSYFDYYWGLSTDRSVPDSNIIGDVNLDGCVSDIDQYYIYQAMTQKRELNTQAKFNADVDNNGTINEEDALCIFNFVNSNSENIGKITAPKYNLFYTNQTVKFQIMAFSNDSWDCSTITDNTPNIIWSSSSSDLATVTNGTVNINKPRFFKYKCSFQYILFK